MYEPRIIQLDEKVCRDLITLGLSGRSFEYYTENGWVDFNPSSLPLKDLLYMYLNFKIRVKE